MNDHFNSYFRVGRFFLFNLNETSSTQHQTPFAPKSALILKRKNGELENACEFVNDLGNEFPSE